jgi:hypothetical protein
LQIQLIKKFIFPVHRNILELSDLAYTQKSTLPLIEKLY